MEQTQLIRDLNERFRDAPAEEVVGFFLQAYKGRIALSSSLSIEDQTLTDIISVRVERVSSHSIRGDSSGNVPAHRQDEPDVWNPVGSVFPRL